MKARYVDVTYSRAGFGRCGLKAAGEGSEWTYDASGKPIGLELTAPSVVTIADVNVVLGRIGVPELAPEDWAPLSKV
ncbi:MAG: hypothetical protein HYZ29_34315 [Myxococcales bacterium]|nr:hypothetical protein [Myxococcales bacterium]